MREPSALHLEEMPPFGRFLHKQDYTSLPLSGNPGFVLVHLPASNDQDCGVEDGQERARPRTVVIHIIPCIVMINYGKFQESRVNGT